MTIHDFDLSLWLVNSEVRSLQSFSDGRALRLKPYGYQNLVVSLQFINGALGIIDNSIVSRYGYDIRTEILGRKGIVKVDNRPVHSATVRRGDEIYAAAYPWYATKFQPAYLSEVSSFVQSIVNDTKPLVTPLDGARSLMLSICANDSLHSHEVVRLSPLSWR
jgi:myo-inositol 2-dehydrogenase/D-chiro-inositol 1-dehydrogenase